MRRISTRKSGRPAVLILALAGLLAFPARGLAQNRLLDLIRLDQKERVRCAFLLDAPPAYRLARAGNNALVLTFVNTGAHPGIDKRIRESGGTVQLEKQEGRPDLSLRLPLSGRLGKTTIAWLPLRKTLHLDITLSASRNPSNQGAGKSPVLRGLRLGVNEKQTRMVLDLDREPDWDLTVTGSTAFQIKIDPLAAVPGREKYGPAGLLSEARIRKLEKSGIVALLFKAPPLGIQMAWDRGLGKWVADFKNRPDPIDDPRLALTAPVVSKPAPPPRAAPRQQAKTDASAPEHPKGMAGSTRQPARDSQGPFVRQKIEKPPQTAQQGGLPVKGPETAEKTPVKTAPEGQKTEDPALLGLSAEETLLYGRILEAREKKQEEQGAALTRKFLDLFPESPVREKLVFLLGDFLFNLLRQGDRERFPEVMTAYQEAINTYRASPRTPMAYIRMSQASSLMNNQYAALGYLSIAISGGIKGDALPLARVTRGNVYLKINKPEKAVIDFKAVLESDSPSPYTQEAELGIIKYYQTVGVYEEARKRLKALEEKNPDLVLRHPEILSLKAKNALYLKEFDRARDDYYRALNVGEQPEGADMILTRIGDTYFQEENLRDAERFFKLVIDHYPDTEGASIAELRLANYTSGVTAFKNLYKRNEGKPIGDLALIEIANTHFKNGHYKKAMETAETLFKKPFQNQLGAEARKLFFRAAEKEIQNYFKKKEYSALLTFYRSREKDLTGNIDPEAHLLVARALYHLQLYADAASTFAEIRPYDLTPTSQGARILGLARSYVKIGNTDNALKLLEKNLKAKMSPSDRQTMMMILAGLYQKAGDTDRAFAYYKQVTSGKRLLPDEKIAEAYFNLGTLSQSRGRYETARDFLNRSIALVENLDTHADLYRRALRAAGDTYYMEKRYAKALAYYEKAITSSNSSTDEDYWNIKFRMASAYLHMGKIREAETLLNAISDQTSDPLLQQRVAVKLGTLDLKRQLSRLSLAPGKE
jgi:tetratricopeptide (TPR) repeat protein